MLLSGECIDLTDDDEPQIKKNTSVTSSGSKNTLHTQQQKSRQKVSRASKCYMDFGKDPFFNENPSEKQPVMIDNFIVEEGDIVLTASPAEVRNKKFPKEEDAGSNDDVILISSSPEKSKEIQQKPVSSNKIFLPQTPSMVAKKIQQKPSSSKQIFIESVAASQTPKVQLGQEISTPLGRLKIVKPATLTTKKQKTTKTSDQSAAKPLQPVSKVQANAAPSSKPTTSQSVSQNVTKPVFGSRVPAVQGMKPAKSIQKVTLPQYEKFLTIFKPKVKVAMPCQAKLEKVTLEEILKTKITEKDKLNAMPNLVKRIDSADLKLMQKSNPGSKVGPKQINERNPIKISSPTSQFVIQNVYTASEGITKDSDQTKTVSKTNPKPQTVDVAVQNSDSQPGKPEDSVNLDELVEIASAVANITPNETGEVSLGASTNGKPVLFVLCPTDGDSKMGALKQGTNRMLALVPKSNLEPSLQKNVKIVNNKCIVNVPPLKAKPPTPTSKVINPPAFSSKVINPPAFTSKVIKPPELSFKVTRPPSKDITLEPSSVAPVDFTKIDPSSVTPVDITKILNKGKEETTKKEPSVKKTMKRKFKVTNVQNVRNETPKKKCVKNSADNQKRPNNSSFLSRPIKTEVEDIDIEYNNLEDQFNAESNEVNTSVLLPTISKVVSQINEEILQVKKTQKVRNGTELDKTEEALMLIKKGLKMIQNWTHETEEVPEKYSGKGRLLKRMKVVDEAMETLKKVKR